MTTQIEAHSTAQTETMTETRSEAEAQRQGRMLVWIGWVAGIAVAGGAGGIAAAAAWWAVYWPAIMTGAMLYSQLREWRQPSRLRERPVGLAD